MKILNSTILFVLLYASIAGAQPFAYITNAGSDNVSVINSQSNKVIATIPVSDRPQGITVSPDSAFVYVINNGDDTISKISTANNTALETFPVTGSNTPVRLVETLSSPQKPVHLLSYKFSYNSLVS